MLNDTEIAQSAQKALRSLRLPPAAVEVIGYDPHPIIRAVVHELLDRIETKTLHNRILSQLISESATHSPKLPPPLGLTVLAMLDGDPPHPVLVSLEPAGWMDAQTDDLIPEQDVLRWMRIPSLLA